MPNVDRFLSTLKNVDKKDENMSFSSILRTATCIIDVTTSIICASNSVNSRSSLMPGEPMYLADERSSSIVFQKKSDSARWLSWDFKLESIKCWILKY